MEISKGSTKLICREKEISVNGSELIGASEIGSGNYGVVYKTIIEDIPIAIKVRTFCEGNVPTVPLTLTTTIDDSDFQKLKEMLFSSKHILLDVHVF